MKKKLYVTVRGMVVIDDEKDDEYSVELKIRDGEISVDEFYDTDVSVEENPRW